jgi:hypothetical protein
MYDSSIKKLVRSSLLLSIAIIFQLIGKNIPVLSQSVTGSVVNAVLLLTTFINGTPWGIAVASLTPILALLIGQLPAALAAFVPFIIIGNIIFVVIFGLGKKDNVGKYLALLIAAFCKYLFLSLSASKLVVLFKIDLPDSLIKKLAVMMGIPQLVTALIGGVLALIVIKYLNLVKQS